MPNCYILNIILRLEAENGSRFVVQWLKDLRREMIGSCIKELLKSISRTPNFQIASHYFDFSCFLRLLTGLAGEWRRVDITINGAQQRGVICCLWVRNNCCDDMQTLVSPLQLSDKIAGSESSRLLCGTDSQNGVGGLESADGASTNQEMSITSSRCGKEVLPADTETA